jgi:transcription elongation GreA/GreB family factor/very-short-patch-repair endonuclease/uncharacterized small protein (DUF1192 family)
MTGALQEGAREEARSKLLQIFGFLKEFNQLRNPVKRDVEKQPWYLWLDELPDHPSIRRGKGTATASGSSEGACSGDDFILKVRRPTLTSAPEPPLSLFPWLMTGWNSPDRKPEVAPEKTETLPNGSTRTIRFEDDPRRVEALAEYRQVHAAWAEAERPARAAMAVFEKLYALRAQIERESERLELMLGDGLLTWVAPISERIRHPILLQSLELVFDPQVPEFTVRETDQPPELYTAPFADVPGVQATAVSDCRTDVEQGGYHPLGGEETDNFFRRIISRLSAHGIFSPAPQQPLRPDAPVLSRSPVLFLRNRSQGFARALEFILDDLQTSGEISAALATIVGIQPPATGGHAEPELAADGSPNGEDEEVLLSKPANPEQLQIAKRLERYGAVLVQGPPGTGKTHTIANLIGHLLAQGKSVLVTSHTAKALKVLRNQVVEPLRPLCVSVLDDSSKQLEAAIDAISERLATSNADELDRDAAQLRAQRDALLRRLRTLRGQLRDARMDENRPVCVAGETYEPAQAARMVAAGRRLHDWIPGPVNLGEPLPLSEEELRELYRTNRSVSVADERELMAQLPNPATLVSPSDFSRWIEEYRTLEKADLHFRADLWVDTPSDQTPESLRRLLDRLQSAVTPLDSEEAWKLAALTAGCAGAGQESAWRDLVAQIRQVSELAAAAHVTLMRFGPQLPADWPASSAKAVLEEIIAHLRAGGSLSSFKLFLKKDWKRLLASARVGGARPQTLEHFEALNAAATLQVAREQLAGRWQRQMASLGAPDAGALGSDPERVCLQFTIEIERSLAWHASTWSPLLQELKAQGLQWDQLLSEVPVNLSQYGDLLRIRQAVIEYLPPIVEARIARLRLEALGSAFADLMQRIELEGSDTGRSGLVMELRQAVKTLDPVGYESAFARLVAVWNKQSDLARRRELLLKLDRVAPAWAGAIRLREGIHGGDQLPGDPAQAWLWRQLNDELDRRGRISLDELQRQIAQLTDELQRLTASLVEKKAWASQVRRTTLQQRMALNGFKELMRRVGRGTGRRAPQFLAEARRLMPLCQSAVPVWIMPLSRVAETFDPRRNRFDVVIIDEASQSDMLALVALYLGRQVVVVGDHEQVSPLAVGVEYNRIKQLIDVHLTGVPNHLLYDGQSSIYDVAKTAFEPVCLLEHFRCVAPIIQFSNYLSYHGKIKPLRDSSNVRRVPPTVAYRVDGAYLSGHVNEREAVAVASLLVASAEQPEYAEATFGVISLLGDEQARRIDQLLQRFMPAAEYDRRRIRCGNAADFQGDERDVMFLSMVDVPSGNGPLSLRTEGANEMYKKRFNVAASRARDQMWVVHSLDPDRDLKGGDIRQRLIKHAQDPTAMDHSIELAVRRAESEFEQQVMTRLLEAGYRVVPQFAVGAYRIDIVVIDGDQRVAVECDGDRWHTEENLRQDLGRQAILERLGWRFIRIRGSQFFRDPDGTMAAVFARLGEMGVRPSSPAATALDSDRAAAELKQRIIRRAAEIRREWAEQDPSLRTVVDLDGKEEGDKAQPESGRQDPSWEELAAAPQTVERPPAICKIGCHVVVRAPDGEEFEFQLVPPGKGDPAKGTVSVDSPVGRAVKDKTAGEAVRVFLPDGPADYVILDVRNIDE